MNEELQSLHAELSKLNSQLEDRVHELEASNNDLSNLLVSTGIATLLLDQQLRIRRYTPAIEPLMRLIASDLGRLVTDIGWCFRDPQLLEDAHRVLAGEPVAEQEIRSDDGHWYLRRVLPYRTDHQAIEGVVVTFTDITERCSSEQRIASLSRERQQHLEEIQALLEAAPVGMFFGRDRSCRDMIMNREGARMLQLPAGSNPSVTRPEAQQLPFRIFHDGRELTAAELPMQQAAEHGITISGFEEVLEFTDGTRVDLLAYAAPLFDERGEVRGCVGTLVDVTEQKRLEAELRSYSRELEEADRRKDEFLAMLGHELRNPLAPIRTTVDLLNLDAEQRLDRHWAGAMIERQLRHLERMVDDLLDLSLIRRGLLSLTWDRHELQALISDSIATQQPGLEDKRQRLSTDLPPEPIAVLGDGTRLLQVFTNLLSNAVRYTQDGGEIRISLHAQPDGRACVRVEDSGKGIASDLLPQVFDIVNQTPSHPDRTHAGLGLGLTLVKQIVLMHGGEIEAASDGAGKGSCFSVWLPIADDLPEVAEQRPAATVADKALSHANATAGDSLDILIVDDNLDVLASLEALLTTLGHRIRLLDGGSKVVATVRESMPDLVLLDLGMPDMDGYQVARALARLPERRRFRVVAVTGYTPSSPSMAAADGDFDAYLLKPVNLKTLRRFLRQEPA